MSDPPQTYAVSHLSTLTPEQADKLDAELKRVLAHGWGEIRITVSNHQVDLLAVTVSNKINNATG